MTSVRRAALYIGTHKGGREKSDTCFALATRVGGTIVMAERDRAGRTGYLSIVLAALDGDIDFMVVPTMRHLPSPIARTLRALNRLGIDVITPVEFRRGPDSSAGLSR